MRKLFAFSLLFSFSGFVFSQGAKNQHSSVAFVDVTVVDVKSGRLDSSRTVLVAANRISAIGVNLKIPRGTRVIDGKGKFLIPGLWDMHTHAASTSGRMERFWLLFLAHGVTGTREMGNDMAGIRAGRAEAARLKLLAPRIVWSSPMLDGDPPSYDSCIAIKGTKHARRTVREMKAAKSDFIKIYNGLALADFHAIASEAKQLQIPIAGEVPDSVTPIAAAKAGMISFEHLWNLFEACVPGAIARRDEMRRLEVSGASPAEVLAVRKIRDNLWLNNYDTACAENLVTELSRTGIWQVPTLAIGRNYMYIDTEPRRDDPRRRWVPPKFLDYWESIRDREIARYGPESAAAWHRRYSAEADLVRLFHKAGAGILAGSDATDWEPFIYPGSSLHDELALLVDAGLSPLAALQSATIHPARFLKREEELGSVTKGKFADLVLLDADPLENIQNVRRIAGVVSKGKYYSREHLDKLLSEAERLATK